MNELLAIVLIVLLCCFLFFAWLFALATCPDRMVNLISGTKQTSSPISRASEDLIAAGDENDEENGKAKTLLKVVGQKAAGGKRAAPLLVRSRSIPANRSNGFLTAEGRANSKKLSVVPEADEQLTVTSISQCLRPLTGTTSMIPRSPPIIEEGGGGGGKTSTGGNPLLAVVKTVLLNRHPSDCSAKEEEDEEGEGDGQKEAAKDDGKKDEEEEGGGERGKDEERGIQAEEEKQSSSIPRDEATILARRSAPPGIHLV